MTFNMNLLLYFVWILWYLSAHPLSDVVLLQNARVIAVLMILNYTQLHKFKRFIMYKKSLKYAFPKNNNMINSLARK